MKQSTTNQKTIFIGAEKYDAVNCFPLLDIGGKCNFQTTNNTITILLEALPFVVIKENALRLLRC